MRERILSDLVSAMKNKDKEVLSVLRMVKGAIQLEEINKKQNITTNNTILSLLWIFLKNIFISSLKNILFLKKTYKKSELLRINLTIQTNFTKVNKTFSK